MANNSQHVYNVTCPVTGNKFFRVSYTGKVYTHAICAVKKTDSRISLHSSLKATEQIVRKRKEKQGYTEVNVISVTYTVRTPGKNTPIPRLSSISRAIFAETLRELMATRSSQFDGVAESYGIAAHGHGSVGIGNWGRRFA